MLTLHCLGLPGRFRPLVCYEIAVSIFTCNSFFFLFFFSPATHSLSRYLCRVHEPKDYVFTRDLIRYWPREHRDAIHDFLRHKSIGWWRRALSRAASFQLFLPPLSPLSIVRRSRGTFLLYLNSTIPFAYRNSRH